MAQLPHGMSPNLQGTQLCVHYRTQKEAGVSAGRKLLSLMGFFRQTRIPTFARWADMLHARIDNTGTPALS